MKKLQSILFLIFLFYQSTLAQDVFQWRGPNRDGIYQDSGLLSQWPENGPELIWFTEELGEGYAAPVVTSDKLLIVGVENSNSTLFAFNFNGKLLWKTTNGKEFKGSGFSGRFPGARSTPTVVGELVYVISGLGRMACFNITDGKEIWAVDLVKDLKGRINEFGYAESVVTDDKKVYCFPGGKDIGVAALDRFTGKTIWTSKATGDTVHFVSPIIINTPEVNIYVSASRYHVFGVDCSNGNLLWKHRIPYKYDGDHCNTPIYDAPYIYLSTGDENGIGTFKLELSGDGRNVREIWKNERIKNALGGFVLVDNKLFVTTENKYFNMLDTKDGSVIERVRSTYQSTIFADNKFICYGTNGDVDLFNYENGKLTPGGSFKITKGSREHFSHPVVANGVLYIRHGEALMAYRIR